MHGPPRHRDPLSRARVLEKAGILRQVGRQRSGSRSEALYLPVADVFKMEQPRDAPEEVSAVMLKTMSTAFRMAERDMKAALTNPSSKTSGPYRNVLGCSGPAILVLYATEIIKLLIN